MGRLWSVRRKKRNFEAEIAEIEQKIKKAEKWVKDLKGKLKVIIQERDMEVHQALAAAMSEKKMDINDVLKLVKDYPVATAEKIEKKAKKKKK